MATDASRHRIVLVAFDDAQMLDVTGPMDAFAEANTACERNGRAPAYAITFAGPRVGLVPMASGLELHARVSFFDESLEPDTLVVCGGRGARMAADDAAAVAAIGRLANKAARVVSICTGAFVLAATGQLDGRRVTTHWKYCDVIARRFAGIEVDADAIFIHDGKFYTSAGVTAGIDVALALIEQDLGRPIALAVARELVVFLRRPGGQSQFSAHMAAEASAADPDRFAELTRWMAEHLDGDLSIERLASRVSMSPRNFARRFAEALGTPPGKFVQALRIDAARRLLTDGDVPLTTVARRCGFNSLETMRLAFQRHLKVAPQDFRARFRSRGVVELATRG
ncbi:GlxA family transcriptional regulator [Pararobbsia silviterrae]|uniref:Helix-turn-helix domain-containing protein n=1 Tax=Pararobbsia silviterrae TaxID=1792498 RepID=A0A494Y9C9_9BURK|nr:DJ-1/PfpI family protein [Pararobbsia silviterrae]RKP58725.1 helix-turn-helix domain-containing protein [Pararobbsia silviterrae]